MTTPPTLAQVAARTVIADVGRLNGLESLVRVLVINDDDSGNYLAVMAGWENAEEPAYGVLLHVQTHPDGRSVIVLENTTDIDPIMALLEAGVAYRDIIITYEQEAALFRGDEMRRHR